MATEAGAAIMVSEHATSPHRRVWRWFCVAGLPLAAMTAMAAAIVVLRATPDQSRQTAAAVDTSEAHDRRAAASQAGPSAPDFVLQSVAGERYRLSDQRGHPVIVNFWATWCGPCREEMPIIEEAYREHAADGLVVLAVNVQEGPDRVAAFAHDLELTFPTLLDSGRSVTAGYEVRALPTTFFITPDGTVEAIQFGPLRRSVLRTRLDRYFAPR